MMILALLPGVGHLSNNGQVCECVCLLFQRRNYNMVSPSAYAIRIARVHSSLERRIKFERNPNCRFGNLSDREYIFFS